MLAGHWIDTFETFLALELVESVLQTAGVGAQHSKDFVMEFGKARVPRCLQVLPRLVPEVGRGSRNRHPNHRSRFRRHRCWRVDGRAPSYLRVYDVQLQHAGN